MSAREVWKFPLPWPTGGDVVSVSLPAGARVLTVQTQMEHPCIWAMVETPDVSYEERRFRIAGTGHPLDATVRPDGYLGTFQLFGGELIFHVFEVGR